MDPDDSESDTTTAPPAPVAANPENSRLGTSSTLTGGVKTTAQSSASASSAYGSYRSSPGFRGIARSEKSFIHEAATGASDTPAFRKYRERDDDEASVASERSRRSVHSDHPAYFEHSEHSEQDFPEGDQDLDHTFFERLRARWAGYQVDWQPQDVVISILAAILSIFFLVFAVSVLYRILRDLNLSDKLKYLAFKDAKSTESVINAAVTERANLEACERQIAAAEDKVNLHFQTYRRQQDTFDDLLKELNLRLDGCIVDMVTKDELEKLSKVTQYDLDQLNKLTKDELAKLSDLYKHDLNKLEKATKGDLDKLSKGNTADINKLIHDASRHNDDFKSLAQQIDELRQRITNLEYAVRTFSQAPSHFDVNLWSPNLGAHVDPRHTSPTYPRQVSWWRVAYTRLPLISNAFQSPPSRALMPWSEAGECWCAAVDKKGYASISIRTPTHVIPSYFKLEHLPAVHGLDNDSAPKTIELWAETEEAYNQKYAGDYPDIGCDIANRPRAWMHCVLKEEFDPEVSTQSWSLVKPGFDLEYGFRRAVVRVTANRGGSDATCIYRLVLGGEIRGYREKGEWEFAS